MIVGKLVGASEGNVGIGFATGSTGTTISVRAGSDTGTGDMTTTGAGTNGGNSTFLFGFGSAFFGMDFAGSTGFTVFGTGGCSRDFSKGGTTDIGMGTDGSAGASILVGADSTIRGSLHASAHGRHCVV